MKIEIYTIGKDHASINGGANNLFVIKVLNKNLQAVKSFTSKLSHDVAEKRAVKYIVKTLGGHPHYTNG